MLYTQSGNFFVFFEVEVYSSIYRITNKKPRNNRIIYNINNSTIIYKKPSKRYSIVYRCRKWWHYGKLQRRESAQGNYIYASAHLDHANTHTCFGFYTLFFMLGQVIYPSLRRRRSYGSSPKWGKHEEIQKKSLPLICPWVAKIK